MKILYADKYITVCHKDAGELSEGEGHLCLPTLLSKALAYKGEQNTSVYPVHRLDKETSGLIVFARTAEAAATLSKSICEGSFSKEYLAVVHGAVQKETDTLCDLLFYDRNRGKSFVVDRQRAGVKKAVLDYTLVECHDDISLLRIKLHTGRTHQIRVQLSSRSLPIYGDRRYGAPRADIHGIALISYVLSFPHPQDKKTMLFTAELPDTMPWTEFSLSAQALDNSLKPLDKDLKT